MFDPNWTPKKLKKVEDMDEAHLCNTIVCESKYIDHQRRNACRMELMKRWTKQLHHEGIKTSIVTSEPEMKYVPKPLISQKDMIDIILG